MVHFKHLIPASLALSIGNAPAAASSSSSSSPAALARQARSALTDNIARLHQSVRRARSIIEMRDADVSVSESKLQDILGEIKSLEKHVSDLLPAGPGTGPGANADATKSSQSNDENGCHGSTDQVGPAGPSRGNANCSLKAGAAARKPVEKSALQTSRPGSSPDAGPFSSGYKGGRLPGAGSDEASASTTEEDDSTPPVMGKTPPGASTPRFLTARPAKPTQQAVISRKPAATSFASPKDGSRHAGPMPMSLGEELTTTTITRRGSSRTTVKITKTRTRTIWRTTTKASRMSGMTKSATPSPVAADVDQDADQNPGGFAIRTSGQTKPGTSSKTKPATSSLMTGGRDRADAGAATRTSAKTKPAGSSSIVGEASRNMKPATERRATATRAPNFTKASPSVNAQQLPALQRFANSTIKLSAPLRAEREPLDDKTVAAQTSTLLAHAKAAAAMTTRKRLTLSPSAGEARASSPPPSGFKTMATRASKRPNETNK